MKIYEITSRVNGEGGFAVLRPHNNQNVKEVPCLDVWWDDWCSGGDKIGDFVNCFAVPVCKKSVFDILSAHFKALKSVEVRINKTEKELKAKNIKRLKWLPKEEIPLTAFFSPREVACLPQSSFLIEEGRSMRLGGVAFQKGGEIIPREEGKGLFFSPEAVGDFDFFTIKEMNLLLLCTERVKLFCEKQNFSNVLFLEMGEII